MKDKDLSRLSVGITYRYDYSKFFLSQAGTLIALVVSIITEKHPPFGDNPYEFVSLTTFLIAINLFILIYTLATVGNTEIKMFPTMLVYTTRKETKRIDFARVIHLKQSNNSLVFTRFSNGKESKWVEIKGYSGYKHSDQLLNYLKYLLKDKFISKTVGLNVGRKGKAFNFRAKSRKNLFQRLIK